MANIMNMVKLKNKTSRNGFDLSNKNLFTSKVGELLPVQCIECLPGDSFDIDMAWFTRSQPVNTAAYTRIREYYDWYFVPTNLLWNKFNTFVTQMTDNNQKATGINGNVTLSTEQPYATFNNVGSSVMSLVNKHNIFGYQRGMLSAKLLEYLNYGDFYEWADGSRPPVEQDVNAKLNLFPLLAYQKIYADFFRDSQWEKPYAPTFNIDYISGAEGTLELPLNEIDFNEDTMFDLRYCNWNKDYFMGLLPNSQYGDAAEILPDTISNDIVLLKRDASQMQSVNYTMHAANAPSVAYPQQIGVAPNSSGEALFKYGSNDSNNQVGSTNVQLKYFSSNLYQMLQGAGVVEYPTDYIDAATLQRSFTILAIRQAEAKQKWAEITQSNQQDYKSQIEAHFGESVSEAYSDRCKYIGGVAGNVDISPVQNQNITGENEADIAGRGEGGSRGSINFSTKVHGYLMCIYHAVPLLDYAIDGIDRVNLKTNVFDYAIPEFDATGMVSVPLIELTSWTSDNIPQPETTLLGYAPRYIDYKSKVDRVHGGFMFGGLDAWVAPMNKSYLDEYFEAKGASIASGALDYSFFKVPPSVLNPIFGLNANEFTDTDQFLINCSFDIKAVRNLDRNGLPY